MTDIRFSCTECGQPLEADESMAGDTLHCPKCIAQVIIPPVSAGSVLDSNLEQSSSRDNTITIPHEEETRISRPNLFWRRISAFLVDLLVLHLLIFCFQLIIPSALVAVIFAWLSFTTIWYFANLRFGRSFGKWLVNIKLVLTKTAGELSPRLLGRYSVLWGPIFILILPTFDPTITSSQSATDVFKGIEIVTGVWFLAMTIAILVTNGHRGLHDLIFASSVEYVSRRFLATPRKICAALGSMLVLSEMAYIAYFQAETDTTLTASTAVDQPAYNRNREYAPIDIESFYRDRVFEVQTRWQQPGGFLWLDTVWKGGDGSGLLFVNNNKIGLICSNWHVVEPSSSISGEYVCRVRRNADENHIEGYVIARAKYGIDLALILIALEDGWDDAVVPPAFIDELKRGEQVVAIGNALGQGISITDGLLSMVEGGQGAQIIRTSAPISPGNSGGPLFLRRGALFAGVVTAQNIDRRVQNINYAIPAEYLYNSSNWEFFLDEKKEVIALIDGALK